MCFGSNFDCLAMEMPTPPKRSYSALCKPCIMQLASYYQSAAATPLAPLEDHD